MKRILLSLLCVAMLTPTTSALASKKNDLGKQSNKIVMEARQSNMEFTAIKVSRGVRLIIDDRTDGNIIIRTAQSLMPYVEVNVAGGELTATISDKVQRIDKCCTEIYIPYNLRIAKICAAGLASVVAKPTLYAAELDISATGASTIKLAATVSGKAEIECAGASTIKLAATVSGKAEIECAGASNITASLTADECEVQVTGASKAALSGSAREADIEVAGASQLDASDFKCAEIDAEVIGASRLAARGTVCDIEAGGASTAVVKCDGTLEASAAGASTITYSGNCTLLKVSNAGLSTIKKQ